MLTVIAAMESELAGVRRSLRSQESPPVELQVIGIGREAAQAGVGRLLDNTRLRSHRTGLLLLGFAAGLDPALEAGDLLLPTCYYHESGALIEPDGAMWHQARVVAMECGLRVIQGNSLTVERVAATPEGKQDLYRRHQVSSVNMEDYWVAELAVRARVPFLAVRAVLDPAYQELPGYVLGLAGRPVMAALEVAPQPWRIPTLLRLARMRNAAQASLTRFARCFIRHQLSAARRQAAAMG